MVVLCKAVVYTARVVCGLCNETKGMFSGGAGVFMYVVRLQQPKNVGQLRTFDDVCDYSRQRMARAKR
jgi:hypothetical protein